jgi:hypothetical protein
VRIAVPLLLLVCGCSAPSPVAPQVLAARLDALPDWRSMGWEELLGTHDLAAAVDLARFCGPSHSDWDGHGVVVMVRGARAAVLLEDALPKPSSPAFMAIFADGVYKGELCVQDIYCGHALGCLILQKAPAAVGDSAASKVGE